MLGIAAITGSSQPRFVEQPPPRDLASGEVLCRTLELGVCGTDREILLSEKPWLPANESHLILGHECLARIEAVGAGVRDFAVGDLVVPAVRRPHARQTRRVDLLPFGTFTERGHRAGARLQCAAVSRSARAFVSRAAGACFVRGADGTSRGSGKRSERSARATTSAVGFRSLER